uniref:Acetyl-coenzyme A carboxylase carboxyl transferase subunit beta n=1 Tax=Aeginetia indica TaxID=290220 RepID=A0A6B9XN75_9LAMI|nr:acetyl-CoA carboxylase carboxyl transferase beta subunit [Aeginetia indica]
MGFLCKFKEYKNSMERWWFNFMVFMFKNKLKRRSIITKSTDNNLIENISKSEDPYLKVTNNILDDTFLVKDNKVDSFYIYFDYCNFIFMSNEYIEKNSLYNSLSRADLYNPYMYDTQSCWNNTFFTNCIDSYLQSNVCIDTPLVINDSIDNYFSECFDKNITSSDLIIKKKSYNYFDRTQNYKQLWVQCETCYGLNYKKFLKSKMNICEQCGYPLKMSSSERIEVLIDLNTWNPMDKDMGSLDSIEFYSGEEPYKNHIDYYKINTGLTEAVQTGVGKLKGIPVAIGVMDFQFMGGSMGSVVGEKITRLIEYATKKILPLIIVCASGGARMQEGSLSLMQMAKISSALYDYQSNKKLLYVSILTSPTTGGVTASFGMLGDIIISEPNSYIAFAGKRVIEQTLNKTVPEGSQVAEYLFQKGLFDLIVPRNLLKNVVSELLKLHTFFPFNSNAIK